MHRQKSLSYCDFSLGALTCTGLQLEPWCLSISPTPRLDGLNAYNLFRIEDHLKGPGVCVDG